MKRVAQTFLFETRFGNFVLTIVERMFGVMLICENQRRFE